jgi:hypothetical protein
LTGRCTKQHDAEQHETPSVVAALCGAKAGSEHYSTSISGGYFPQGFPSSHQ